MNCKFQRAASYLTTLQMDRAAWFSRRFFSLCPTLHCRDDSFHTAGNQSYNPRLSYISGSNHSHGLGGSNHSLTLDQLGSSNHSHGSHCIDHTRRRYSSSSPPSPLAPLSTLSRPNGSDRCLSPEASFRKRSRFLPDNADDFFQSFPTLTLVTHTDVIQEEQDDERDIEAASDMSSVSSTDSSGSPSARRKQKRSVMQDASDASISLAQLITEMEDERVVKKKEKAELKKWEKDQGHVTDEDDDSHRDKKRNKDDMSVSDANSASIVDVDEHFEKQLRYGLFSSILSAIVMCGLGGLVGKITSWFKDTDAADIAADFVDDVQQELTDVTSRMLIMQQTSQNSSTSLVVGAPIPFDGGANQV